MELASFMFNLLCFLVLFAVCLKRLAAVSCQSRVDSPKRLLCLPANGALSMQPGFSATLIQIQMQMQVEFSQEAALPWSQHTVRLFPKNC